MANTLEIILRARDEASAQLKAATSNMSGLTNALKQNQQALTMIAVGGGAAAGALGFLAKAAADEETSVIRLSVALRNVGVSYDAVKGSLEGAIAATQRKTGIADDQQRAALQRLLIGTSDYDEALRRLPIALDLAAATGMDAAQAGQLLGRITDETSSILTRYGITLKEGATATEALAAIQQKVGGTAEEMGQSTAGAMNAMKAAVGDAMESFGTLLLPAVTKAADALRMLAEKVTAMPDWLKKAGLALMAAAAAGGIVAGLALMTVKATEAITAIRGLSVALLGLKATNVTSIASALAGITAAIGPAGWAALAALGTGLVANKFISGAMAPGREERERIATFEQGKAELQAERGLITAAPPSTLAGEMKARAARLAEIDAGIARYDKLVSVQRRALDSLNTVTEDIAAVAVETIQAVAGVPLEVAQFLADLTASGAKEWWQNQEEPILNVVDLRRFQEEAVEAQKKAAEDAWNAMEKSIVTIFDPISGEWQTVLQSQMTAQQSLANMQAEVARYELSVIQEEAARNKILSDLQESQAKELHALRLQKEGFYAGALSAYVAAGGQAQLMSVGGPGPVDDPARRADINRRIAEEYARVPPVNVTVTVRDETGRALSLLGTEVNTAARVRSE